jgi:hypothetical protein
LDIRRFLDTVTATGRFFPYLQGQSKEQPDCFDLKGVEMARIEAVVLKDSTNLIPRHAIVVHVASFQFGFGNLEQLKACIDYYSHKTHPTSRIPAKEIAADLGEDWRALRGWEIPRWFERLPMYLMEEPKRKKVLKALQEALEFTEKKNLLPTNSDRRYTDRHSALIKR